MIRSNYQKVWRWHFYAGLFVIPFLIILSITGIIYLFKPQLDRAIYRSLLVVTTNEAGVPVSADALMKEVVSHHPDSHLVRYVSPTAADASAEFILTNPQGESGSAFVDPWTGQYLGARWDSGYIQVLAKKIHGELMIGKIGDRLVELAACWTLVLLLTGLYLWWPRTGSKVWGVWLPRLRSGGRAFWKDVHSVLGVYSSIFITLFILSGLPWAGFWGDQFAKVWNTFPNGTFSDTPKSSVLNQGGHQVLPWAAENAPMPKSKAPEHEHGDHAAIAKPSGAVIAPVVSLQQIVELAEKEGAPAGYSISFPSAVDGVYTIAAFTGQPTRELTIHVDQYSGEKLLDVRYKDYGFVPKLVEYGIALHQGQLFGWLNQLICLLICLAILLLCASGIIMWWKRRPAGSFGVPPAPKDPQRWTVAIVIAILLGIAFPLVGFSMLAIWLIDFFVAFLGFRVAGGKD